MNCPHHVAKTPAARAALVAPAPYFQKGVLPSADTPFLQWLHTCFSKQHQNDHSRVNIGNETCAQSPTECPAPASIQKAEGAPGQSGKAPCADDALERAKRETPRALLLEDDARLRGMLRDAGFQITIAQGGQDALRGIMASDFTIVFCDMSNPGRPGSALYRVIARISPHLCERFVCITERPRDREEHGLSKSINGLLLFKPVESDELQKILTFFKTSAQMGKQGEDGDFVANGAVAGQRIAMFRDVPPPSPIPENTAGNAASAARFSRATVGILAALGLFAGASRIMIWRAQGIDSREQSVSSQLAAREKQWDETSARLREIADARQKLADLEALSSGINQDRKSNRWTHGLQNIANASGSGIELRSFSVRLDSENPDSFVLRLTGSSSGADPLRTADEFRAALEETLKQGKAAHGVKTRLEHLSDSPAELTRSAVQSRAVFTIFATSIPEGSRAGGKESHE